jgi:hypothetical protein
VLLLGWAILFLRQAFKGKFGMRRGMPDQEQEESVDAFMDSKESFYTDLDFAIDGSDDSSDAMTLV